MGEYRRQLDRLLADYRHARQTVLDEKTSLKEAKANVRAAAKAQALVQQAAETIQASVHEQIAGVVTRCLQTVFGDDSYTFKIHFVQRRGRTEAELVFVRDEQEIDPISSSGGGVVDIASFALRLSCLMLMRPAKRRLLVLDEPFRFLSKDYRPVARSLLQELSKELSMQIIMVTHAQELVCGKIIHIGED